jgi:arabinogalactan endo-1,4-beta-galactosidase
MLAAVPSAVTRPVRHGCEPPAWCGVDLSELALEDADGTAPPFRASLGGQRQDALQLLRAHGPNVFRMRLWNDPCADGRCDPAKFAYANLSNVLRMVCRMHRLPR